jgi:hypothetical protein
MKDHWRRGARRRECAQSLLLLGGIAAFWVLVVVLNHLVHVLSSAYIATSQ